MTFIFIDSFFLQIEAVSICNMNQAKKSAVRLLNEHEEYAILQSICRNSVNEHVKNSVAGTWEAYREVLLKVYVSEAHFIRLIENARMSLKSPHMSLIFIFKVSQSCEKMIISCQFGHVDVNCTRVFSTILTDSGLCCIFNGIHKKFMMQIEYDFDDYCYRVVNSG